VGFILIDFFLQIGHSFLCLGYPLLNLIPNCQNCLFVVCAFSKFCHLVITDGSLGFPLLWFIFSLSLKIFFLFMLFPHVYHHCYQNQHLHYQLFCLQNGFPSILHLLIGTILFKPLLLVNVCKSTSS